jgi:8-oxo-dGTP diphosphatase
MSEEKKEYVLGFMFSLDRERVALIRKNKPDWQKGKLNGIGGKVELNESKYVAMTREFAEECGYHGTAGSWLYYCRMEGKDWAVHCFASYGEPEKCRTMESEPVEVVSVRELDLYPTVENLTWLIRLAVDYLDDKRPGFTVSSYDEPHPFVSVSTQAKLAKAITALRGNKRGIYTASKVKHAAIWRHYRDQGFPIISTWIDEAEEGESSSYEELSVRCIEEAKSAQILMLFCEDEEILKGALIEAGAALASNVQIACIGDCPSLSRVFKEHPLWKEYASPAAFFYAHRHLIASTTLAELKGE